MDSPSTPLCIDLDGTLIRTDMLYECFTDAFRQSPWVLFLAPFWLLFGKARLKSELARRSSIDPATLPYAPSVRALIEEAAGHRPVILCTATNIDLAVRIAEHVGGFTDVIASDAVVNNGGTRKAEALVGRFGQGGFDYAGNAYVDLAVWARARRAIVCNASPSLAKAARGVCGDVRYMENSRPSYFRWLKALRLHQWLKNLLIFVPLLAGHLWFDMAALGNAGAAFIAFGLCASGVYILNDLLDLSADRVHPRKRNRPFAAGDLPLWQGLVVSPLLTLAAFVIALLVSPEFAAVLLAYFMLTLAYSFRLKRMVMVDVITLASLYTLRIVAGIAALDVTPSFWLLAFSMFLFLSLAMLKRYTELRDVMAQGKETANGRGYNIDDLPLIQSLGTAAGYLAVLVLALYINSEASQAIYRHKELLWLLCPLLLYWISRAWMIAHRDLMHDDPVIFAARDRTSQMTMLLGGVVVLGAI